MSDKKSIDAIVENQAPSAKKILLVDTGATVTYSLIVGTGLDYAAGLNLTGIIASRTMGTASNSATGGLYGWWRELAHKFTRTNEKSGRARKVLTDLLAFNTFRVPTYYIGLCISSYISEGEIKFEKAQNGALYLAAVSPFIGPTLGLFIDGVRRGFRIKPAAEGAYKRDSEEARK